MFRRLAHTLPQDPVFPADLSQLGFFINDKDQIRLIAKPEQKYQFNVNRNDRVNDVYKEAMNTCVRRITVQRLSDLGFEIMRLPVGAAETENHVPILISPNITRKKRIIVIFGERDHDLGIFSYRVTGEEGIHVGTALEFATAVLNGPPTISDNDSPGIIITNPGQLIWYRGGQRAVSWTSWHNLPRKNAVCDLFQIDPVKNMVPENKDFREHVTYVFENVLKSMDNEAKFDVIGLEYPGSSVIEYLAENWNGWNERVNGICLGSPQHNIDELVNQTEASDSFCQFIRKRCRAYFVSPQPLETPLPEHQGFGCNCYASGETLYEENVIVRSWRSMLDWFNFIHANEQHQEIEPAS